jgi:hypothetical protein
MSSLISQKLIVGYSSAIKGATEVAREGIVVIRVGLRIGLEGTGSLRIEEAGIVVKRSFALKEAFLAFKAAILAFIATSLSLIPRRFSIKSVTFACKAASCTLA